MDKLCYFHFYLNNTFFYSEKWKLIDQMDVALNFFYMSFCHQFLHVVPRNTYPSYPNSTLFFVWKTDYHILFYQNKGKAQE